MRAALAVALAAALASPAARAAPAAREARAKPARTEPAAADDPLARYYTVLAQMKLVDVTSGDADTLRHELAVAEGLIRDGAYGNAAVALYAIVKSPRYASLTDFVEFQNAEYDLAVALARAGSYGASLDIVEQILRRGSAAPYWAPAHRRAVDIALETRDPGRVLARLEAITSTEPVPLSAAGERSYLRGHAAYDAGKLADAEGELALISKKSRLYTSAVYLRGVIKARRGEYKGSAEAMCEIAATEDNTKFTFVVDDRYFTVKDLARLGLGRVAHEQGEYDDAYYHFFQIPDDSSYLPEALFDAAWSMYQKRELATARDLVHEFLVEFPSSPLWPEASLLAGYVELADCKFDASQQWYDALAARLQPVVAELDRVRKDPALRRQLFATALTRYRETKQASEQVGKKPAKDAPAREAAPLDDVLALLRLDPKFLRLSDAVVGAHALAGSAPGTVRLWQNLGKQVTETRVAKISTDKTLAEEQLADANAVVEDLRRLGEQLGERRADLARGKREGTVPADVADAESVRLGELSGRAQLALERAIAAADSAAATVAGQTTSGLRPLLQSDLADARRLDKAAHALAARLEGAADKLAEQAIEKLYVDTRRVLDKARLGKVDAVIGQKRKLDIQVQDLAQGRFPEELIGRLWNASMIGDDEEFWPFQGEYWADEYEGFR